MILAGFAFASTLISTAAGLVQIAAGLAMLGAALAGLSATGPLVAIGIAARWTQWFQTTPKGPHGTHRVVLYLSDTVIDGHAPLDLENQRAAARIIAATKRWSQDIAIQYGVRGEAALRIGAAARRGRRVRVNAPRLGDAAFAVPCFTGAGAYALRSIRINSKARET